MGIDIDSVGDFVDISISLFVDGRDRVDVGDMLGKYGVGNEFGEF